MTTSGTYTYAPVVDDLVVEAWERCGKSPAILTGDVARSAKRSIILMLIDWSNRDTQLWQVDNQYMTCVVGQALYQLPVGTTDVLDLWITVSGQNMQLSAVDREQYAGLPEPADRGQPTQYWVERRRDLPVLHLWPTPNLAYVLTVNRLRLPQDVSALSQTPDAPILWSEALTAGLAARLALKFAPDRVQMLKADALDAYTAANGEDRERVPLRIAPDMRSFRW